MGISRIARSLRVVIVPAVIAALVAFPLGVLANHSFADVPASNPFHADIAALKDSGVSPTGCGGGNYCPDDFVTRGQMAAFLNRLGALGPGKTPVANATKLDGLDSSQLQLRVLGTCGAGGAVDAVNVGGTVNCTTEIENATNADNATTADNADNAGTLDGLDSTAFQDRVDGTCAAGGAVASVGSDGSVTCNSVASGAVRITTETTFTAGQTTQGTAYCGLGKLAVGGGYLPKFNGNPINVYGISPEHDQFQGWGYRVYATNPGVAGWILIVAVLCVDA